jgi:lysophospholipase L1-like esterase
MSKTLPNELQTIPVGALPKDYPLGECLDTSGNLMWNTGIVFNKPINAAKPVLPDIAAGILAGYSAAIVTAGSTITAYEIDALECELSIITSSSIWPKLRELWVPCGSSIAGAYVKLKFDATAGRSMTASVTPPTYTQATGMLGVIASSTKLITGINPNTNTKFTDKDWGFGAFTINGINPAHTGVIAGMDVGNYVGYNLGGDAINGVYPGNILTAPSGLRSVQVGGGSAQSWYNSYFHSSIASAASNTNGVLNLLSTGVGFFSDNNIGGYACWSPSLTKVEFGLLANFFRKVNRKLRRAVVGNTLVAIGDSNTIGVNGITTTQRWPYLVATSLGLANNAGAEINNGINGILMAPFSGQADYYTSYPLVNSAQLIPPILTVQLGTNDMGFGVSSDNFKAYYSAFLDIQLAAGINMANLILIGPIWSSNVNGTYVTTPAKAILFSAIVKGIAATYGCNFFDGYAITAPNSATWFQGDGLHLNVAGNTGFASALSTYISNLQY